MSNRSEGFRRGLEAAKAKPATQAHGRIAQQLAAIEADHARRISAGAVPERLAEIAAAKIVMLRAQARQANQQAAQVAARSYQASVDALERKFSDPTARLAAMEEARLTIGTMDKGALAYWARRIDTGEISPASHYELIVARGILDPDHPLLKRISGEIDPAEWTPEGRQADADMRFYSSLGDNLAYTADDGTRLSVGVQDLYLPVATNVTDQARQELEGVANGFASPSPA
ncbi:MAG TPA: hypothetical protein VMV83_16300 [Rectinemataceae bacterium]|nr:hypothetical protein [Rectinemataceae bacterium]